MDKSALRLSALVLSSATILLSGCGIARQSSTSLIPVGRQGVVHGGQQPVSGAAIQLYAVGTTGDASAATPLLTPAVTTDANGGFTLTGAYTCPSPSTLVYLIATGGNPGLSGSASNPNLAMMAALGPCGNLSSSTFIVVNELTTVGAVYALAPYIVSPSAIGSGSGDASALASAFTLASELVNTTTGTSPGANVPAGTTIPTMQINLLGDILAACVNSPGGISGDSSSCGNLFSLTTPTTTPATPPATDTITALLHLANNPTLNTQALSALPSATAPFQPVPSLTPPSFAVTPTYLSGFSASPSTLNFGALTVGFTSTQAVTLTNNGTTPVVEKSATLIGTNGSDFSSTPLFSTCPAPLFQGVSCIISVQFHPHTTSTSGAYLQILTNDVNPEIDIPLSGQGAAPAAGIATLSSSSLTLTQFGVPKNVTLTNFGNVPLTINGINFGTSTAFSETDNCGTSLPAQSICTIVVTAAPGASSSAVMTVVDDAAAGPQTLNVAYTGNIYLDAAFTTPGSGSFGPTVFNATSFNFGSWPVGGTGMGDFSFFTTGTGNSIPSTSGILSGPNASDFGIQVTFPPSFQQNGACESVFRLECDLTVRFIPSGTGLRTATLTTSFGVVTLTGTGQPVGDDFTLGVTGTGFPQMTTIGGSYPVTVTATNTGTLPLTLNAPAITGPNASQFSVSQACGTLASGATCSITLTATPTQLGPISATLTEIDSTGTVVRTMPLYLGETPPAPQMTPSSLTFPPTQIGSVSASQMVTVTAYNNDPVTITSSSGFQFSPNSCPQTPCQISVTFAPTAAASFFGTLGVIDTVYGYGVGESVRGTGLDGLAAITLSPNSLTFPLRSVGSTSIAQTVTLTNSGTGSAALGIGTLSLTGTNPGDFILTNGCPSMLATGTGCSFTVSFSPSATGARTAAVQINSNASSSPDFVQLSGTAQ